MVDAFVIIWKSVFYLGIKMLQLGEKPGNNFFSGGGGTWGSESFTIIVQLAPS